MQEENEENDLLLVEARAKTQAGLEALARGDAVTGTTKELSEQAIARSRARVERHNLNQCPSE